MHNAVQVQLEFEKHAGRFYRDYTLLSKTKLNQGGIKLQNSLRGNFHNIFVMIFTPFFLSLTYRTRLHPGPKQRNQFS